MNWLTDFFNFFFAVLEPAELVELAALNIISNEFWPPTPPTHPEKMKWTRQKCKIFLIYFVSNRENRGSLVKPRHGNCQLITELSYKAALVSYIQTNKQKLASAKNKNVTFSPAHQIFFLWRWERTTHSLPPPPPPLPAAHQIFFGGKASRSSNILWGEPAPLRYLERTHPHPPPPTLPLVRYSLERIHPTPAQKYSLQNPRPPLHRLFQLFLLWKQFLCLKPAYLVTSVMFCICGTNTWQLLPYS